MMDIRVAGAAKSATILAAAAVLSSCSSLWYVQNISFDKERIVVLRSPALCYEPDVFSVEDVPVVLANAKAVSWAHASVTITSRSGESSADIEGSLDAYGNTWIRLPEAAWEDFVVNGGLVEGFVVADRKSWRCRTDITQEALDKNRYFPGFTVGIVVDPEWDATPAFGSTSAQRLLHQ